MRRLLIRCCGILIAGWFAAAIVLGTASAQVQVDSAFDTRVAAPQFVHGSGPVVLIDEAHNNAHTLGGRYAPFVHMLRSDGFRVAPLKAEFTGEVLKGAALIVIANASASNSAQKTNFPVASAFSLEEIETLRKWVVEGGSLLLIADHAPWGGAAEDLAKTFGVLFSNGYAMRESGKFENFVFSTANGSLVKHAVTRGRRRSERVDAVVTFTGQAFRAPALQPVLRIPGGVSLFLPERAGELTSATPRIDASALLQGAVGRYGRGRLAVFGEAAMFTAQLLGPSREPMGMNHPTATQNKQFVLNVAHWLVGEAR